jgi:S1-C subfamily serine protease
MRGLAGVAGCLLAVLVLTGCGAVVAEAPPDDPVRAPVPRLVPLDPDVRAEGTATIPTLARDSAERKARRGTVRVRNTACDGVYTGSGFALDAHTLVTNRHVLAGASLLELSTWDGRTLPVRSAFVSRLGDLGIAHVDRPLPQVLTLGGAIPRGSSVTAVGYPLGGELRLLPGVLVDEVSGAPFGIPGSVMRLTTAVQHGNSGGPLLDANGRVVGVIFAIEIRTRLALAIPVATLRHLVATRDLAPLPPCGSE